MNQDNPYAASTSAAATIPAAPAEVGGAGLAVTSLVLGIIGLCVPLVGLVALVIGVIVVVRAGGAGRGLGIAGICLGGVGLIFNTAMMAGLLLPALGAARENARIIQSVSQMQQIRLEVELKAVDDPTAWWNPNLEQVLGATRLMEPPGVLATGSGTFYLWLPASEGADRLATDPVIAENPSRFDRRRLNVVFADGSLQVLPREQVEDVIKTRLPRVFNTDGTAWTSTSGSGSEAPLAARDRASEEEKLPPTSP